jgi:hypothetical protein
MENFFIHPETIKFLEEVTEKELHSIGYSSVQIMQEKDIEPRMQLKARNGEITIIDGVNNILEKFKEIRQELAE